jgi:hypothetical protein
MTAATLLAALPATPAAATLGPTWTTAPPVGLPVTSVGAEFRDVTVLSPTDVWAVGAWWDTQNHPLTAHWDGRGWTVVPAPPTSSATTLNLTAVDATSDKDMWAVGSVQSSVLVGSIPATLAMHYDGAAWSVVPTPAAPTGSKSVLKDVDMLSASDGWAVGQTALGTKPAQALILRWQAGQWTQVPAPATTASLTELNSVYARAADDVWAVGSQLLPSGATAVLVMHFDGVAWQPVSIPDAGTGAAGQVLNSVAALSATDVWAAGQTCQQTTGVQVCQSLVMRLVNGAWQVVPTTANGTEATEIVPLSASDVWMIGYTALTSQSETDYAEHWNGVQFVPDNAPIGVGELASALEGAAADPVTGAIWAVGWSGSATSPTNGATHAVHRG